MAEGRLLLRVEDYTKRTEVGAACVLETCMIIESVDFDKVTTRGIPKTAPRCRFEKTRRKFN